MSDVNNYKVYAHVFPNGKHYIGITQQDVNKRWKYGAGYTDKQPYIHNAIKKYGWNNIEHIIIYENLSREEAEGLEVALINLLKSNDRRFGYNIAKGGSVQVMSLETRKKISDSRKGMVFNEQHIKNLSESHKGFKPTAEQNFQNMMSNPRRKPIRCVETGDTFNSIREAGRITGIRYKTISAVLNKKYGHKTAGGYHWEYVD